MTTVVNVLSARVRMEEKWVIEALAGAGVVARPLPPAFPPLPLQPPDGACSGGLAGIQGIVIDRCADRIVAGAIVPLLRSAGVQVIDAGLASTANRFAVANALTAAGIARPETMLVTSEAAGIAAVRALGLPATFLPLDPGHAGIALWDIDLAEATLEHRAVLGSSHDIVGLVQAGSRVHAGCSVLVVDGRAIAVERSSESNDDLDVMVSLAERAAHAVGAGIAGIELLMTARGLVVWDIVPVPDFRTMQPLAERTAAQAIAEMIMQRMEPEQFPEPRIISVDAVVSESVRGEVSGGVVLTA